MRDTPQTGFVPQTIDHDNRTWRYALWVPSAYTPTKPWPVILFMHGKGECGDDGEFHTTVGLGRAIRANPERFPALVVMPQIPVDHRWEEPAMQALALATLDATRAAYACDDDRVILTGLSLGGYGTWTLGARQPERFAALVPVCGGGDPADATPLAQLPIWCFHGDDDPVVPVGESRRMVAAVRDAGGDVRYDELRGVGHRAWDPAYGNPQLVAWMLHQRRKPA